MGTAGLVVAAAENCRRRAGVKLRQRETAHDPAPELAVHRHSSTLILGAMAYDEELAHRIRAALQHRDGIDEKRMFGGLAFLVNGHMAVAASGQGGLLARVDPAQAQDLVDGVHVDRMVMRGRAMDGWLRVDAAALDSDDVLAEWVARGVAFAATLPPKAAGPKRRAR